MKNHNYIGVRTIRKQNCIISSFTQKLSHLEMVNYNNDAEKLIKLIIRTCVYTTRNRILTIGFTIKYWVY